MAKPQKIQAFAIAAIPDFGWWINAFGRIFGVI
jgi:hypothetical protein